MKREIAIAGASGFLGGALCRAAAADPRFALRPLSRAELNDAGALAAALQNADALLYFAGMSRSEDGEQLYRTNLMLAQTLADALTRRPPDSPRLTVYFASTTHDAKPFPYHASKRDSAVLLLETAGAQPERLRCVVLRIPNVFGPGGRPFFNSAVATFAWQAAHGEAIRVNPGSPPLKLIHADTLTRQLLELAAEPETPTGTVTLEDEFTIPVEECAELCRSFASGHVPGPAATRFERLLYRQFCAARKREMRDER